jgi:hypothetical protein
MRGKLEQIFRFLHSSYLGLVVMSATIVVASTAVGIYLEQSQLLQGFIGNLLSETAGIFFGIVVTLLVVRVYDERIWENRWKRVRKYTLRSIARHLCDFASDTTIFLGRGLAALDPILEGREAPHPEAASGFKTLAEVFRSDRSDEGSKSPSDRVVDLYEHSRWELDQIQTVLTPRLMQAQAEQDLVDALIEFDEAHQDLRSQIIAHKLIRTGSAYPALISLIEVSGNLYGVLDKYWRE